MTSKQNLSLIKGVSSCLCLLGLFVIPGADVGHTQSAQIDPRSINPVLLAAGFSSGQATWTGRFERVTLYDHTPGIRCQYKPQLSSNMFWESFRGSTCPQFVDVP